MRCLRKIPAALFLVCLANASTAVAADWSGFYIGMGGLYQNLEAEWTTTNLANFLNMEQAPIPNAKLQSPEAGGGFILGYNKNTESGWVLGLEISTESIEHEYDIDYSDGHHAIDFATESNGVNLRLRGGYLFTPDMLLYLSMGRAELDVTVSTILCCTPRDKKTLSGNAPGLGMQYALSGMLLRAEYIDMDMGYSFNAMPTEARYGEDARLDFSGYATHLGVVFEF